MIFAFSHRGKLLFLVVEKAFFFLAHCGLETSCVYQILITENFVIAKGEFVESWHVSIQEVVVLWGLKKS